jgi:hypothetical protein
LIFGSFLAIVREACEEMLIKYWFVSASQDPITLLRMMDVEGCTQTCETALQALIKKGVIS